MDNINSQVAKQAAEVSADAAKISAQAAKAAALEESRCTVLEAVIPGGNEYTATEKLWVDNETLKPVQFIIYDAKGNETYHFNYHTFDYNVELEDSLFKITE